MKELHCGDLDQVRQGLRMAAPPDPERLADEKRVLGGSGFHLREGPLADGAAEMGMWVRASEAGRGLGTDGGHNLTAHFHGFIS